MESAVPVAQSPLVEYFIAGGFLMWPLLGFGIITVAVIVERLWAFRGASVNLGELVGRVRTLLLAEKDLKKAVESCRPAEAPVAIVLRAGLLKYGLPTEDIERTLEYAVINEMTKLERGLGLLVMMTSIAPITGFLGTVVGMIESFDSLAKQGLSNPAAVAVGIKVALITTAAGLLVALPAALAHSWLTARVQRSLREMEMAANVLLETFGEMRRQA